MRIKNTRELVLRARGHARRDHIEQGTYGNGRCNGFVEFKGCAIGCLATPHRKSELRSFIRRLGWFDSYGEEYALNETAEPQLPRLKSEFGICEQLARCAEALFEGFQTHGDAINFIPEFAAALNEGADLTPRKVRAAWNRLGGQSGTRSPYLLTQITWANLGDGDVYTAELVAPKFLAWLREQR